MRCSGKSSVVDPVEVPNSGALLTTDCIAVGEELLPPGTISDGVGVTPDAASARGLEPLEPPRERFWIWEFMFEVNAAGGRREDAVEDW